MYTAWLIDQSSTAAVRQYVSACKVLAAQVLTNLSQRTTHIHGSLGVSNAMSLGSGGSMGLVDGPTEVHKIAIARSALKDHEPHKDGWPSELRPRRMVAARRRFEEMVDERFADEAERSPFHSVLQESEVPDGVFKEMEEYLDAILGNL
jgi:acyl-CoA dehydrogenase